MDGGGGGINKNLGTLVHINTEDKVLSGKYYLLVYVYENLEGTLKII